MTERIILSVVAIAMLVFSIQKKDKQTIFLTAGLALGILITWTGIPLIITIGLIIYMLTALVISISGLNRQGPETVTKVSIVVCGIWAFGSNLFAIMPWPYAGEVKLSMLIPLTFYLILLAKGLIKKKEFSFLTIMNTDFLIRLLRFWN